MRLSRFGDYTFPAYNPRVRWGGGVAGGHLVPTAAGAYDPHGSDTIVTGDYQITRKMTIVADSESDLDDEMDDVRALVGTKETLYALMSDGNTRRCKARCIGLPYEQRHNNVIDQDVEVVFEILTTHWNGEAHTSDEITLADGKYLDDGWYLDSSNKETMASSPHTITVNNGGNKASTYNIITITAGSAAITAVKVENTTSDNSDVSWAGTLAAGKALVINTGTFAVTNDTTNDYANMTINAGHAIGPWLRLDKGNNAVKITFTGGSTDSTVGITYWDGWK